MFKGDVSIYQDQAGVEHVALVTEVHTDGTVDLAVLKTNQRNVSRSAVAAPGKFFDPTFVEEVAPVAAEDAPPNPGLQSVSQSDELAPWPLLNNDGSLREFRVDSLSKPTTPWGSVPRPDYPDPMRGIGPSAAALVAQDLATHNQGVQAADVEPEETQAEPTRQFTEKEDGTLHEVLPEAAAHGSPADETPPTEG